MKLTLKVFDPTLRERSPSLSNGTVVNKEVEIYVEEKIILDLVEHIIDNFSEIDEYRNNSSKTKLKLYRLDKIIKSARAWKKIHTRILNMGKYEANQLTRISLIEELMNNEKIIVAIDNAIRELNTRKMIDEPKEFSPNPQNNI